MAHQIPWSWHLLAAGVLVVTVLVGYWAVFGILVYLSPLPYAELDFNHNGHVEFSEADYAAEHGTRKVKVDGRNCVEYFALKDGRPLKVVCDAPL